MNKPTIDEILAGLANSCDLEAEEPNRYTAVMVTAKRARQINSYYHSLGEGGCARHVRAPACGHFLQELPQHRHGRSGQGRDRLQATPYAAIGH